MTLSLLAVHQAANDLLTCVCEGLARVPDEIPGLAGCPCRVCVIPGAAAADGCDADCGPLPEGTYPGQLTVNVVRIFATERQTFPRETLLQGLPTIRDLNACAGPPTTAVELLVTLFRCAPGGTGACPPTCEELNESAMQLHADMLAVQSAIMCCYAATDTTRRNGRRFVMGPSRTLGPQGLCVGLEQRVVTALDDCLPCLPVDA